MICLKNIKYFNFAVVTQKIDYQNTQDYAA